jgi:hypothetical protein
MFIACLNFILFLSYFKYSYRSIPLSSLIKTTTTNLVVTEGWPSVPADAVWLSYDAGDSTRTHGWPSVKGGVEIIVEVRSSIGDLVEGCCHESDVPPFPSFLFAYQ